MYQIRRIKKFPDLECAFSTVSDGNMSFKFGDKKKVIKNREEFLKKFWNLSTRDGGILILIFPEKQ
ncbi:hypothetical protein A2686_00875 [Candidatus Woesebacteria bacterium RIFCSPHIGHO2_01_FULL_38_10]|uniref:Uncharacterized protein n=1 Tax=Candidatus Woesebacteria bacterium RIFCSPLOWO2_01_FULL_39_10b TaxID=1802517 RepID=A0A1F8B9P5_9BACT|nr:MAG: hypothetical protein A2686_00875 [Candidatus Woesebacteria bacterium RIFCSPHIGHO2_01_FULL_38_10]OGM60660.1 MAG: hypothetical protein A2892_01270 [Candidatus Woesebacteria bacterium RIFCSPLOWO2_01_FULL_39_10b]